MSRLTQAGFFGAVALAALTACAGSGATAVTAAGPAQASSPSVVASPAPAWPELAQALATAAAPEDGVVGAAVIHIPSGRAAAVHGDDRFLMASVYKVPIALALLDASDSGKLALGEAITITRDDVAPGMQPPLAGAFTGAPLALPLARLLELMVGNSDNTATDAILRRLGGPTTVAAYLARTGHAAIHVDRDTRTLYAPPGPQPPPRGSDLRDTTTPLAMARLLAALANGQLGTPAARTRLLAIMTASQTQAQRLRGKLPPGTPVAHKSGTAQNLATNAVGIVTLPPPHGQLAVAVFVTGSRRSTDQQGETIAAITRAAYDVAVR
jgi:beta-lactamase class A